MTRVGPSRRGISRVGAAATSRSQGRLPALALRTALVAASSFSLYITDRYHNADKRREGVSEDGELANLRCDYVGISLVLSTNLWLWSRNLGIGPRLGLWSAAATAHVLAQSVAVVSAGVEISISTKPVRADFCSVSIRRPRAHVVKGNALSQVPRYAGHVAVKLTLATQFVGLLGALVIVAARSAVPACAAIYAVGRPRGRIGSGPAGISARRPRRRRDRLSNRFGARLARNIRAAAAASPRPVRNHTSRRAGVRVGLRALRVQGPEGRGLGLPRVLPRLEHPRERHVHGL